MLTGLGLNHIFRGHDNLTLRRSLQPLLVLTGSLAVRRAGDLRQDRWGLGTRS